ncbi:sensor histidine kinase [Actinoplanes sp. NPDC020271]|uniref:sensor histidine kinase n=1 Tax=Actinoplanes sp. NPDC020271 TaxID=3363896 RepID=UPI0037930547
MPIFRPLLPGFAQSASLTLWLPALLLGSLLAGGALAGLGRERLPLAADLAAAGGATLALGFSRLTPLPVLVVSTGAQAGYLLAGWNTPALVFAMAAALYQLAVSSARRVSWTAALLGGAVCWAASGYGSASGWWSASNLSFFAWTGLAAAVGDAGRNRRAYVAEVEARARRAEHNREEEVARRIAEERLRIARDLHDVVAHHIAVINVQAGAATFALTRQPEAAGPPLTHIRQASSLVLKELTSIVGLLRGPGDTDPGNQPQPGIAQLPALIENFANAEFTSDGEPRPLPAGADLAAYRITQEALTNARKHGDGGPVRVHFRYGRDHLDIEIINRVRPDPWETTGAGYGLIGMRERAGAAGGRVETTREDDSFTVRAVLPVSTP